MCRTGGTTLFHSPKHLFESLVKDVEEYWFHRYRFSNINIKLLQLVSLI